MDLTRQINWYAVYTKPCREDIAAMHIRRLGLEVLLPKVRREKLVWGIPQVVIKPFLPNYLFARFCSASHLHMIHFARGVRRVVSAGTQPLPVDEEIIRAIQERIGSDGYVSLRSKPLQLGDEVVVQEGPLRGVMGIFEREMDDRKRLVVLLEAVEYQARLLIEKDYLKLAAQAV